MKIVKYTDGAEEGTSKRRREKRGESQTNRTVKGSQPLVSRDVDLLELVEVALVARARALDDAIVGVRHGLQCLQGPKESGNKCQLLLSKRMLRWKGS